MDVHEQEIIIQEIIFYRSNGLDTFKNISLKVFSSKSFNSKINDNLLLFEHRVKVWSKNAKKGNNEKRFDKRLYVL